MVPLKTPRKPDPLTANLLSFSDFAGMKKRDVLRLWKNRGEVGPCKAPYHAKSDKGLSILVPCRDCMPCRRRKQRERIAQCAAEAQVWPYSWVDTLTYEEQNLPETARQDYIERNGAPKIEQDWLKRQIDAYQSRLRYHYTCNFKSIIVTQLGTETQRLHHHAIHFPQSEISGELPSEQTKLKPNKVWPYGHIMRDAFSPGAARYVVSYLTQPGKGTISVRKSNLIGWAYFEQWLNLPSERNHPVLRGNPGCFNIGSTVYPIPRAWRDRAESLGHTFPDLSSPNFADWVRNSGPLKSSLGHQADRNLQRQKQREKLAPSDPTPARFDLQIWKNRKRSLQSPQELANA